MKKNHIIIALVAFVIIVFISATSFENEKTEYEYLSMHYSSNNISISSVTEGYKVIKVSQVRNEIYDIKPLLQLIESYENSGYELFEFNTYRDGAVLLVVDVLMRKSK